MFTREDYNKWLEDDTNPELNKKMVEEFPFLLPRNVWTGEVVAGYDYHYNELWALLPGWQKAFGYELICELRDALVAANYLHSYRISQIKEKYGSLRWYDFGATEEIYDIIHKYEKISETVCQCCGDTNVDEYGYDWLCEKCAKELKRRKVDWKSMELF